MFDYSPFWETLKRKGISQYKLIYELGVSAGTLDALRKNNSVTINTIVKLCIILDCTPNDIVRVYNKEEGTKGGEIK